MMPAYDRPVNSRRTSRDVNSPIDSIRISAAEDKQIAKSVYGRAAVGLM